MVDTTKTDVYDIVHDESAKLTIPTSKIDGLAIAREIAQVLAKHGLKTVENPQADAYAGCDVFRAGYVTLVRQLVWNGLGCYWEFNTRLSALAMDTTADG